MFKLTVRYQYLILQKMYGYHGCNGYTLTHGDAKPTEIHAGAWMLDVYLTLYSVLGANAALRPVTMPSVLESTRPPLFVYRAKSRSAS